MTTEHKLKFTGCSPHNGEYWYECTVCRKTDWIASYGTEDQIYFYRTPCSPPKVITEVPKGTT